MHWFLCSSAIMAVIGVIQYITALLRRSRNRLAQPTAHPDKNIVWLLDSTAYHASVSETSHNEHNSTPTKTDHYYWHAEIVACVFHKATNKSIDAAIAQVADESGLDGKTGSDEVMRKRIEARLQPFLYSVAPGTVLKLNIPVSHPHRQVHEIGPADSSGVCSQIVRAGHHHHHGHRHPLPHLHHSGDVEVVQPFLHNWDEKKPVSMDLTLARPEGWLVVSDIDDTIKHTMTPDMTGVLRTTFAEDPKPIEGMPEFYARVQEKLSSPAWFYVSASPYNLYPFLRDFVRSNYNHGTLMLRTYSVLSLEGLHKSLTENTQGFKSGRIQKIHDWFPRRRVVCVGDSTQKDPETYAEMHRTYPGWIRAIFIRRVTNAPHMERNNTPERFDKAFNGIPRHAWRVFERPEELDELVDQLSEKERLE